MKVNAETAAASQAMTVSLDPFARVDERETQRQTAQSQHEQER